MHAERHLRRQLDEVATCAQPVAQWGLGRFVLTASAEQLHFRDWLVPPVQKLPRSQFEGLAGTDLQAAYFRQGFIRPALSSAPMAVADAPQEGRDSLFWQYPCRTEAHAWAQHKALRRPGLQGNDLHIYVGLPWATWIDKEDKQAWGPHGPAMMQHQTQQLRVRIFGYRQALAGLGLQLRVHTVCQHIGWQKMLPIWRNLGITDAWLSHCEPADQFNAEAQRIKLHPWRLFAVNAEDVERSTGLQFGRDPATKPLLASFVGADAPHYISDIRRRLAALPLADDCLVRLRPEWHFERTVYREQVAGMAPSTAPHTERAAVAEYNRILSASRFALCPAGAGRNTLRLWEALAVGAVPVLLGPPPELPRGGSLAPIDWEAIVIREPGNRLTSLLHRLRAIPIVEVRRRSVLGREAFDLVTVQRCFA